MNYNISSDKFDNPILKELLVDLTDFFRSIESEFYIIGATARDLVLCNIYDLQPNRKTFDLDIAIAVETWEQFEKVEANLPLCGNFEKVKIQKQRFIYKGFYNIDIVPFGGIAEDDGFIYWPPKEEVCMSVVGFTQMAEHTISIVIDDELVVKVASLVGVCILKLSAWKDRHLTSNKDANDIAVLIASYFEINQERVVEDHFDLYELDDFDTFLVGGCLIARDILSIVSHDEKVLNFIKKIIESEVEKEEESRLINQMIETNNALKYEQVLTCLQYMVKELNK